jgi:hypothetical protein
MIRENYKMVESAIFNILEFIVWISFGSIVALGLICSFEEFKALWKTRQLDKTQKEIIDIDEEHEDEYMRDYYEKFNDRD